MSNPATHRLTVRTVDLAGEVVVGARVVVTRAAPRMQAAGGRTVLPVALEATTDDVGECGFDLLPSPGDTKADAYVVAVEVADHRDKSRRHWRSRTVFMPARDTSLVGLLDVAPEDSGSLVEGAPGDRGATWTVGASLPDTDVIGDQHRFDRDVAAGLTWTNADGDALTAAVRGDVARWDGDAWVRTDNLRGADGVSVSGTRGSLWSVGAAFPPNALSGDQHRFDVAVSSGLVWQDGDGNALTAAAKGDTAEYDGAAWVQRDNVKGDKGDKGDKGVKGDQGVGIHTGALYDETDFVRVATSDCVKSTAVWTLEAGDDVPAGIGLEDSDHFVGMPNIVPAGFTPHLVVELWRRPAGDSDWTNEERCDQQVQKYDGFTTAAYETKAIYDYLPDDGGSAATGGAHSDHRRYLWSNFSGHRHGFAIYGNMSGTLPDSRTTTDYRYKLLLIPYSAGAEGGGAGSDYASAPTGVATRADEFLFRDANGQWRIKRERIGDMLAALLVASDIPNLDAAKITTGVLSALRIPGLAASKITSGQLSQRRLPESVHTSFAADATLTQSGHDGTQVAFTGAAALTCTLWTPARGAKVVVHNRSQAALTIATASGEGVTPSTIEGSATWTLDAGAVATIDAVLANVWEVRQTAAFPLMAKRRQTGPWRQRGDQRRREGVDQRRTGVDRGRRPAQRHQRIQAVWHH